MDLSQWQLATTSKARRRPVIHLVSLELSKAQWAFRRLCVDYEVVFHRRELNSVFMTVGVAYSMFRFPSRSRWSCQGSRHCCPLYRPA